jgi:uncharacterized protein (DUF2147 family)
MIGATLIALAMATSPPKPDTVLGHWKTETRNAIVDITRCGTSICGKLLMSDGIAANPALTDIHNKDAALRGRRVKGAQILGGFTFDGGVWTGGTIYNGEDGKTYDARITMVDANTLKLRGCIFVPLCKNQVWHRVP